MPGDIKMEVIAVKPVRLGPKHRAKRPAGAAMHLAEEPAIFARAIPAAEHCHAAAILERERREIDGVALRVFGEFRAWAVVARPAGIARRNRHFRKAASA